MAHYRFQVLAVVLSLFVMLPVVRPEEMKLSLSQPGNSPTPQTQTPMTRKIYSLVRFGDDPSLGKWIADTIPDMIQPGTWNEKHRLSYNAPTQILVVYHTESVHAQVEALLHEIKKSLPPHPKKVAPKEPKTTGVVLAQPRPPRHLFHFILRYEGEGVVGDTVTNVGKNTYGDMLRQIQSGTNWWPKSTTVGMKLPSGWYLQHPPQYIPPTPDDFEEIQTMPRLVPDKNNP